MILALDIGNSRLKWALVQLGKALSAEMVFIKRGCLDIVDTLVVDELEDQLAPLSRPASLVLGNVADKHLDSRVTELSVRLWGLVPIIPDVPQKGCGVTNSYAEPSTMGIDRFAAMVGAHARYRGAKLIVDAGSAVNIELLDENGTHLGGLILPGINMMRRALFENTKRIPPSATDATGVFGRNTAEAITFGTQSAVLGAIGIAHLEARKRFPAQLSVLFTGGGAEALPSQLGFGIFDDELVLDGLARMGGFACE